MANEIIKETANALQNSRTYYDYILLFFVGLQGVGAIIVAIIALFNEQIKLWIRKPKIEILVGDQEPYIEYTLEKKDDNQNRKSMTIRISLINKGKATAKNSKLLISEIYSKKPNGDRFKICPLMPHEFKFQNGLFSSDILPQMSVFLNVGIIANDIEKSEEADSTSVDSTDKSFLYITIGDQNIKVANGQVICPFVLFSETIKTPEKHEIEINWNGTNLSNLNNSNFSVSVRRG